MSARYALLSVSDKTELAKLAAILDQHDIDLLSTSGTLNAVADAGLPVTQVSAFTGAPEIMGGRVKTIHPKIAAGILNRRSDKDRAEMANAGYGEVNIDFVIVNLYPFKETVASGAEEAICIENIDIGGPSLLRAAAKNFQWVCVIVDPADYPALIAELEANNGQTTLAFRKKMATKAISHTRDYDTEIAAYFSANVK
jgi:phosphoribosylaminoimidazolecarboxamide formyltransferase/IMP cyclohydrolase